MPPDDPQRMLRLTFRGEGIREGAVPITIVAAKLEALQALVFHAAATVEHDTVARRGQWMNRYRDFAELCFQCSHSSALTIEAALSPSGPILSPDFDRGARAVDFVFRFARVFHENPEALSTVVSDRQEQSFLLRSIESLCPGPDDDYEVHLENCTTEHRGLTFTGETRQEVRRVLSGMRTQPFQEQEEAAVVGTLTKIHVEVGPPLIAVKISSGTEIHCFYDEAMRDQIANLMAGSIVEVRGIATRDAEGRVRQIDSVIDVEPVSMEPVRLSHLQHGAARFKLHQPLRLDVAYSGNVWIYHNVNLNLWGVGGRREDALSDLSGNFDYLWAEFAQESDERLDSRALEIKRALIGLVDEPSEVG